MVFNGFIRLYRDIPRSKLCLYRYDLRKQSGLFKNVRVYHYQVASFSTPIPRLESAVSQVF
jgi:hypothetical protein